MSAVLLAVEEFGMASLVSNILFLCAIALIVFSPFISRAQHIRGDDGVFNFRCQIDSKRDIFLAIVISPIAYVVTFLFGAVILWVVNSNIIALFFYLIPVPLILGSLLIMKILFRLEAINIKLILKSFVIATYGWIITFSIIIGVVFSFELFLNRHILFLLIKTEELGIETPVILKYGLQIADNVVLISPSIALALLSFFVLLPTNRLIYGLSENRITDLVDE